MKSDYLIDTFKSFESFKQFLIKYNKIQKLDNILKEFKEFPYKIIIRTNNIYQGYNNLFKYSLVPYNKLQSKIIIKELTEKNQSASLHITNILYKDG